MDSRGWNDRTSDKALTLRAANRGSIPGTPYSSLSSSQSVPLSTEAGVSPEHCCCGQQNKTEMDWRRSPAHPPLDTETHVHTGQKGPTTGSVVTITVVCGEVAAHSCLRALEKHGALEGTVWGLHLSVSPGAGVLTLSLACSSSQGTLSQDRDGWTLGSIAHLSSRSGL